MFSIENRGPRLPNIAFGFVLSTLAFFLGGYGVHYLLGRHWLDSVALLGTALLLAGSPVVLVEELLLHRRWRSDYRATARKEVLLEAQAATRLEPSPRMRASDLAG